MKLRHLLYVLIVYVLCVGTYISTLLPTSRAPSHTLVQTLGTWTLTTARRDSSLRSKYVCVPHTSTQALVKHCACLVAEPHSVVTLYVGSEHKQPHSQ